MDDDIIRILVTTDNHLGFAERDPVRCDDCYAVFEEVLATARRKKVDFVLMAGDMFHENRPTRRTLHNTMELLRKYCLGEDPVYTEILNDQKEIFKASFGRVNYEDPYQSVCLPVFSIHGNHDDPSREGGSGDALAALDLLAVSNLVNYFGKADRVEDIEITPILMRKGNTNIAIYGLGAIRDERLNRMWNQKKVKFVRLTEEQGREDYFNIFVLHQNRDYGRGSKNCVHESMIPEWMDLVIWGNEHECQPQLMESLVGTYRILQPGSSIASSYSSTESSLCPKHMAMFDIKEKKFRMRAFKYKQVRQFVYRDLSLRDFPHLDPNHSKIEEQIRDVLVTKANEMILEARAAIEPEQLEPAPGAGIDGVDASLPPVKFRLRDPQKVLLRLRVDHEGFPALNQQRFGANFVGEVANAADILLLAKKRKETSMRATEGKLSNRSHVGSGSAQEDFKKILAEGAEDEISKIKIEDLVNETLSLSNHTLALLAETEMAQALDDYIVKKQPNAITDMVIESLNRTQKALQQDKSADDKTAILKATARVKEKAEEDLRKETGKKIVAATLREQLGAARKAGAGGEDDEDEASVAGKGKGKAKTAAAGRATATATARGASKASTNTGGRGKGKEKAHDSESEAAADDDDFSVGEEADIRHVDLGGEEEGEEMDVDSDDAGAPKKGKGKAAAAKPKAAPRATKKAAAPAPAKRAVKAKESPAPAAAARSTGRRAAASKPVSYALADSDEEDNAVESDAADGLSDGEDLSEDGAEEDEEASDDLQDSDSNAPRGRAKVKPSAKAKAAGGSNAKVTKAVSGPRGAGSRAAGSSAPRRTAASEVIDLGDDDEGEAEFGGSGAAAAGRGRATPTARPASSSAAAGRPPARSAGVSFASAIHLDDDIVDDEGFVQASAGASARSTQPQSTLRLPGGTTGKKRQLPLSFSQSAPSQASSRKPATNKSLASGWDD